MQTQNHMGGKPTRQQLAVAKSIDRTQKLDYVRRDASTGLQQASVQRIRAKAYRAYEKTFGRTLQGAADIASGVRGSSQTTAPGQLWPQAGSLRALEESSLRIWAREKGLLLDYREIDRRWREGGRIEGAENRVFLNSDRVFKSNNLSYHRSWADLFDRIALHHALFPEASLRLEGFVETPEGLRPVVSQPVVRAERGAVRSEVEAIMRCRGFVRTRNDDYRRGPIVVEDLHDENVFVDKHGNVVVIDPAIFLKPE